MCQPAIRHHRIRIWARSHRDRRTVLAAERLYHAFPPAAKRASIAGESEV